MTDFQHQQKKSHRQTYALNSSCQLAYTYTPEVPQVGNMPLQLIATPWLVYNCEAREAPVAVYDRLTHCNAAHKAILLSCLLCLCIIVWNIDITQAYSLFQQSQTSPLFCFGTTVLHTNTENRILLGLRLQVIVYATTLPMTRCRSLDTICFASLLSGQPIKICRLWLICNVGTRKMSVMTLCCCLCLYAAADLKWVSMSYPERDSPVEGEELTIHP